MELQPDLSNPAQPTRRTLLGLAALTLAAATFGSARPASAAQPVEWCYEPRTRRWVGFTRRWWEFDGEAVWRRELDAIAEGLYDHYRIGPAGTGPELLGIGAPSRPAYDQRTAYAATDDPPVPYPPGPESRRIDPPASPSRSGGRPPGPPEKSDVEPWVAALRVLQSAHGKRVEAFYAGLSAG